MQEAQALIIPEGAGLLIGLVGVGQSHVGIGEFDAHILWKGGTIGDGNGAHLGGRNGDQDAQGGELFLGPIHLAYRLGGAAVTIIQLLIRLEIKPVYHQIIGRPSRRGGGVSARHPSHAHLPGLHGIGLL